jgi:putative ABC transport system permease protein
VWSETLKTGQPNVRFCYSNSLKTKIINCQSRHYIFGTTIEAIKTRLNTYTFHINLYDLVFLITISIGLTFTLLLGFSKRINQGANRFLALALCTTMLYMTWALCIDIRLETYPQSWSWLPLHFSLAFGPLIFFYVRKITRPESRFVRKDLFHFSPLLLELFVQLLEVKESARTGAATYNTLTFNQLNPIIQLLGFISVSSYLYATHRLICHFYRDQKFIGNDRYRYELRWLHNPMVGFGVLWLLWIPFTAVDYFYYHNHLVIHACHPFYLLLAVMMIWIAVVTFLRPEVSASPDPSLFFKLPPPVELKQKGIWLKKVVKTNSYYEDPELSLVSLAEKLELTTHELSRIINTGLKKSFNDFINEYRVAAVTQKMQHHAYDHFTLLAIAFESGFNSKTTFNRAFKHILSKSPAEYKKGLKKERPSYNLERYPGFARVISFHEATPQRSYDKLNRYFMFMIKNYLKAAWRNITRNKVYSAINIAGLAIGIACAGLIFLWAADEVSYDNFNVKKDRLYSLKINAKMDGNNFTMGSTPRVMGRTIKAEIPGIANFCRISDDQVKALFKIGDKSFYANGKYADPALFSMFTLPFVQGNAQNPFTQLRSVVLTEKTALKFFGEDKNLIGKTVRMDNKQDYVITGILKDIPENSTVQAEWFIPYNALMQDIRMRTGNDNEDHIWHGYGPFTYVELEPDADVNSINRKLYNFIHQKEAAQTNTAFLYPITRWHLYEGFTNGKENGSGRINQVKLLSIIAWVILLIACINFMNLATARSEKRAKEIGVRKVLGSGRRRLIWQFITESIIMAAMAAGVALIIMLLALPAFNNLVEKDLSIGLDNPVHLVALVLITLICGLLAGSYPSLYLSSFDPVKVLKGLRIKSGAAMIRKSLVVVQFTVSVVFIVSTIVVYQQIQHVKSRDLGINKNNLVEIDLQHPVGRTFSVIKQQIVNTGAVSNCALTDHVALYGGNSDSRFTWDGRKPTDQLGITFRNVTSEFMSTVGMHIVEGRDFRDEAADTSSAIVTQSLARLIDKNGVIGKVIQSPRGAAEHMYKNVRIVGVVQDYVLGNMYDHTGVPVIFLCHSPAHFRDVQSQFDNHFLYVKIKDNKASQQTLADIAAVVQKNNPDYPFQYRFVDDQFNEEFKSEVQTSSLSGIFAILAIVISCLGLFSLAAYTAERRIKEIGIRKVLGASVSGLAGLLSKDFLQLVGISCLVAFPVAWYIMYNWLQNYEYRVIIHWWIFAAAGVSAMAIALATVSFQAIKAALTNPVKNLRSE